MGTNKFSRVILYSILSVVICLIFTILCIDPLWQKLGIHVPGEPENRVNFTEPVDTIFYLRNAENGYVWSINNPTSLWFHPLLIWLIAYTPQFIPLNYKMLVLSLISGVLSILLNYRLINVISPIFIPPWMMLFIIFIPGFIGISTGNAEIPCLLLTTLLMLSVVEKWGGITPLLFGALAILCKPNALYMIPVLGIYLIYGVISKQKIVILNTILGLVGIIVTWIVWVLFVDYNVGQFGSYWIVRNISTVPLTAGPLSILQRAVSSVVFYKNNGETLKYVTAISIPIIDMAILLVIKLRNEYHRMAFFCGLLAIIFITFAINNPNKIIVYSTTLPCHLIIGILFIKQSLFDNESRLVIKLIKRLSGISYISFCSLIIIFYILGTPLGWYY